MVTEQHSSLIPTLRKPNPGLESDSLVSSVHLRAGGGLSSPSLPSGGLGVGHWGADAPGAARLVPVPVARVVDPGVLPQPPLQGVVRTPALVPPLLRLVLPNRPPRIDPDFGRWLKFVASGETTAVLEPLPPPLGGVRHGGGWLEILK